MSKPGHFALLGQAALLTVVVELHETHGRLTVYPLLHALLENILLKVGDEAFLLVELSRRAQTFDHLLDLSP